MKDIFEGKGIITNNIKSLTSSEAYDCCKNGAVIIDVRDEYMSHIKTFDVPEIMIFTHRTFSETINDLPTDKYLIFADATGIKSKIAIDIAHSKGFTKIANLAGGLVEWEKDGMPTITHQRIRVMGSKYEFVRQDKG